MYVARGKLAKTAGGVDASGITVLKKKDGSKKYVSTSRRKNALHNRWIQAGKLARKELKTENKFMPFKKGTPLYNKTKQIYNDLNQKWEGARVKAAKNVSTASKKKSLSPSGKLLLGSPWWKSTLKIYNKSVPK